MESENGLSLKDSVISSVFSLAIAPTSFLALVTFELAGYLRVREHFAKEITCVICDGDRPLEREREGEQRQGG